MHDAVGARGHFRVVGGYNHGHTAGLGQLAKQIEDGRAGFGIEVAGGLVRQQQGRAVGEGAGDGDALLFAAGQFVGLVEHALGEADGFEQAGGAEAAVAAGDLGQDHGRLDVFHGIERGQEVEALEDEADAVAAVAHQLRLGSRAQFQTVHVDFAAGGAVQSADEVEQRGFAGAGRSDERHEFAARQRKVNLRKRRDDRLADAVAAGQRPELDEGFVHERHIAAPASIRENAVAVNRYDRKRRIVFPQPRHEGQVNGEWRNSNCELRISNNQHWESGERSASAVAGAMADRECGVREKREITG